LWAVVAPDSALMRTITIGLAGFIDLDRGTHWNELMAASLLSTLPLIALFLFTQRFFVQSVAASGLKG
jgi:ABC-type glycerol-3-phosphate transport system permease component